MPQNYSKRFNRGSGRQTRGLVNDVTRTPSPEKYSGLPGNPQFTRTFETQSNVPVEGAKRMLRALSPFTISVMPPLVFDNVPQGDPLRVLEEAGVSVLNSLLDTAGGLFNSQGEPTTPGDLVVAAALAEWERDVREPKGDQANGRARINDYIQSAQGSGWTDLTYEYDGQEGADWCGHFAAFCYGAAGISSELKRTEFQSTYRVFRMGRRNSQRLIGGRDENGFPTQPDWTEIKPGDIAVWGQPGSGKGGAGKHIMIVEYATPEGVYTIEGNTRGRSVDGSNGNGVMRNFRPFVPSEPGGARVLYAIRPLPDDYDTPYYDDSGYSDAGLFSPVQSRLTSGNRQNPGIVDVALAKNKAFSQGKKARERTVQKLLNDALGGRGTNAVSAAEFVAQGVKQAEEEGFSQPAFSDKLVAVDALAQLEAILDTPPLTLLINPNSFQISYTNVQQFSQRTRYGYIFQRWGEEKPKITFSGTIGAYMAGQNPNTAETSDGQTFSPSGVQFASRRDSASFQNLLNLLAIFKHNGYIYDRLGNSNAHLFVGGIAIDYDNWTYIGNFDSFNWGEEETKPNGGISFDVEFVVTQMYDNDQGTRRIRPLKSLGAAVHREVAPEDRISFDAVSDVSLPSTPVVESVETLTSSGWDQASTDIVEVEEPSFEESSFVVTSESLDEDGNLILDFPDIVL